MQLYKRISLLLSLGIMGIGLITFTINAPVSAASVGISENTASDSSKTPAADITAVLRGNEFNIIASPTPVITKAPSPTPTPVLPNDLLEEEYPDIHQLVTEYLNANLECSIEAFEDIVTDTSYIDLEERQKRTEAIREYTNIKCYTKRGINEIDYVVYYTYEMIIPTIDTPAVSIDFLNVAYEDDRPKVFFGEVSEETYDYLKKLESDADVVKLINDTTKKMNEAITSDEALKAFWVKISESTSSADNTNDDTAPLPDETDNDNVSAE